MQHTTIRPQGVQPPELLPSRFRVTRTDRDGTESWTGSATELETALRRAIHMTGCTIEAHRDGGATIVRTVPKAAWDVDGITLRYKPIIPANLTEQRSADLRIIAREPWVRRDGRGLTTPRYEIPPAATARLFARGLVTEDAVTGDVGVSIVARLALLADEHRTRTTQPRGSTTTALSTSAATDMAAGSMTARAGRAAPASSCRSTPTTVREPPARPAATGRRPRPRCSMPCSPGLRRDYEAPRKI
ncbi:MULTISPECIES: hypothetical protein [unclassified Nocardia]|uniref:hypothetical protein n=1 Tax=unclassified Nocardia TaxID=2637762 RepID=UPI00278C2FFA|nr:MULTISPECIES: hypothetical protein [unclassified Nocardia]